MAVLVFAHPYPDRSRANRILLEAVQGLPGLAVRSLYELYPDFAIDIEAEQAALAESQLVVWQHPMYWYSVPALMKLWFDKVLARGWAYGEGGTALKGKQCLWVTTTGGDEQAFSPEGMHNQPFRCFEHVVEQTARFCGMHWQPPLVVYGAHRVPQATLDQAAARYREHLVQLIEREPTIERDESVEQQRSVEQE